MDLSSFLFYSCSVTDLRFCITWEVILSSEKLPILLQALTAVLQLGVTMDYSIFLLNSYEENKKRFPGEKERAMGHAISNTFKSVAGSSVTTVAWICCTLCYDICTWT